jgi:nucleotide-binding universal stress UspA family protein
VHAIDPLLAEAAASLSGAARLKADARAELEALGEAERKRVPGLPAVTSIVRVGPPAREILASARDSAAALVVMGTQGLGGIRKLFFGSIAEKVLRDAAVPVLAVPLPESAAAGAESTRDSEAGVPEIQIVIASVELDASAEAVIGHAVSFARGFGLPVMLLHVVPPVEGMPRAVEAARAAERLHETNAQARLAELADHIGGDVEVEIRSGSAAEEIAAAAAARHALVTIASGGEHGHHRPGSIAYRVLCLSEAPVLAVPFRRS